MTLTFRHRHTTKRVSVYLAPQFESLTSAQISKLMHSAGCLSVGFHYLVRNSGDAAIMMPVRQFADPIFPDSNSDIVVVVASDYLDSDVAADFQKNYDVPVRIGVMPSLTVK